MMKIVSFYFLLMARVVVQSVRFFNPPECGSFLCRADSPRTVLRINAISESNGEAPAPIHKLTKINLTKMLIIDDEVEVQQVLNSRFSKLGYHVVSASDGKEGLKLFEKEEPDVVLLDILLPKMDGYEVCARIRKNSDVPIIVVSGLQSIADRVMGLEMGADDYVVKPFSPRELELRVINLLKRVSGFKNDVEEGGPSSGRIYKFGDLTIDTSARYVMKKGSSIKLTEVETNIFDLLIENAGEPLTREIIVEAVWGYKPHRKQDERIVDVHVSRLREKIEDDPSNPALILTVRGVGYKCPDDIMLTTQ